MKFGLIAILSCAAFLAGCAGNGGSTTTQTGASGGSGVTVFGTIDAGVSHTTNKSAR